MRKRRVCGDADDVRANAFEIFVAIAESGQFRRTDEREIKRIENHYEPLSAIVGELYVLVQFLDVLGRAHIEIRRGLAHHRLLCAKCCCCC